MLDFLWDKQEDPGRVDRCHEDTGATNNGVGSFEGIARIRKSENTFSRQMTLSEATKRSELTIQWIVGTPPLEKGGMVHDVSTTLHTEPKLLNKNGEEEWADGKGGPVRLIDDSGNSFWKTSYGDKFLMLVRFPKVASQC